MKAQFELIFFSFQKNVSCTVEFRYKTVVFKSIPYYCANDTNDKDWIHNLRPENYEKLWGVYCECNGN